jgi:1-aminocyclopropane-1-carboxylate deaminase/D-cysteine desulfhydrase-like pyridoxal-dependent ACC family enzyme
LDEAEVVNLTDYVGESYGVPSREGLSALHRLAHKEGILLDPVYSSKGFSGLLDFVARGVVTAGQCVVFVHTGGLPAVFAYAEQLVESAATFQE